MSNKAERVEKIELVRPSGGTFVAKLQPITYKLKDAVFAVEEAIATELDKVLQQQTDKSVAEQMRAARNMTNLGFKKDVLTIQRAFSGDWAEHDAELFCSAWDSEFWQSQELEGIANALGNFRKRIGLQV